MQTFYMTDAGKVRTHNEDNVTIISNNNNEFILAVADGMGGHKAGEVASNIAIEHITESFESIESLGKKEDAIEWLRNIVKEINNKIFAYTREHPSKARTKSRRPYAIRPRRASTTSVTRRSCA